MPQREYVPKEYQHIQGPALSGPEGLILESTDTESFEFTFQVIRPGLFRTTFSSKSHPLPPHPSVRKPAPNLSELISPTRTGESSWVVQNGNTTVSVDWNEAPLVSIILDGQQKPIHRDLPNRSYVVDSTGIAHYTHYRRDTLHVGLGEKAAPMNLSNRHFILSASDCFGYDIYRTDPLYKQIPLLINATPDGCVGIFSASHSRGTYSVGSEIDGLWDHFKVYRQDYGGLEEYLMVGKTIEDVVRIYADLAGYPLLVPRWAFGYIAGGMKYSMLDEPPACSALVDFARKLEEHDIPCSAFQLSSGYTVAETEPKTRNVFTWNNHRFPDPKGFVGKYLAKGIRIIANVKPYVLGNHPEYKKLVDSKALFFDPRTEKSAVARLWSAGGGESAEGGHIDFTSKSGFQWWFEGVQALRKCGIEGIWNDNNEYTVPNDDWQCALTNMPKLSQQVGKSVGLWGRSLHCELMAKSSHHALVKLEPNVRPFVLTRSATAGTMRYAASSWAGDNVTSWESMKGANSLSLNAGMSLLQSYGHDIGGFEGPQPEPELLLRWIQLGVHSPRFAINCFKTDENDNTIGGVIEPWMYPEIISLIRDAIKRRYELIPYLYSLMLESHMSAIPPQRWTGWGFEEDPEVWKKEVMAGESQYWLGDTLLVGGVYEPGKTSARVYLPRIEHEFPAPGGFGFPTSYLNLNYPYQHLASGKWVEIQSDWKDSIPLLARVGGAIIVGKGSQTRAPGDQMFHQDRVTEDDYRAVEIFPPPLDSIQCRGRWPPPDDEHEPDKCYSEDFGTMWYEDDGIAAHPEISSFHLSYQCVGGTILVNFEEGEDNKNEPVWKDLHIILPFGDGRGVVAQEFEVEQCEDNRGRSVFRLRRRTVEDGMTSLDVLEFDELRLN